MADEDPSSFFREGEIVYYMMIETKVAVYTDYFIISYLGFSSFRSGFLFLLLFLLGI